MLNAMRLSYYIHITYLHEMNTFLTKIGKFFKRKSIPNNLSSSSSFFCEANNKMVVFIRRPYRCSKIYCKRFYVLSFRPMEIIVRVVREILQLDYGISIPKLHYLLLKTIKIGFYVFNFLLTINL